MWEPCEDIEFDYNYDCGEEIKEEMKKIKLMVKEKKNKLITLLKKIKKLK